MISRKDCLLVCTLALSLAAGGALAQTTTPPSGQAPAAGGGAQGMVTVDLTGVKPQIAQSTGLAATSIPSTVQIPPSYAAKLCGVPATSLAGGQTCKATTTDEGFNTALKNSLQKQPGATQPPPGTPPG
jgi:hypothetical protein